MSGKVLIIDDVEPLADQYAFDLERLGGFTAKVAVGGAEGLAVLSREVVDCVILDLEMPDQDGFDVLRAMDHHDIRVPVIVYTGTGSFDRCVEAVRLGAFSFIDKAEPMERVVQEVRLALGHASLRERVEDLEERLGDDSPLIGSGPAMSTLKQQLTVLARIPSPVLVLGESGTGKELVAFELHRQSPRSGEAFVPVNCGGMAEGLVESDLFGHEKGAFTGAVKARRGAFERATKGTLFLDEIGELPAGAQARLLRVLEVGEVSRLGAEETIQVEPRVVAATHRDLDQATTDGAFREDLLYRLNVHVLRVPPLRERSEDIPELVDHFVTSLSAKLGIKPRPVTAAATELLQARRWERNNIRELRNTVERMLIASTGPVLDADHVPEDLGNAPQERRSASKTNGPVQDGSFKERKKAAERQIILEALEANDWKITEVASTLGLSDHASLLKIMRRHGIQRP
ncbi:MAG: sigma-54-dependent transcriptional regulator [Longimicrobiales bacterium]